MGFAAVTLCAARCSSKGGGGKAGDGVKVARDIYDKDALMQVGVER